MNGLAPYWPTLANIKDCIRTEAETADEAVLLATHEPMLLRLRMASTGTEELRTEQDMLRALMVPESETSGSAVVVAITGASGVGKSHMVRWLHAQLQRHPSRERLVIVLIPKTASLRQVVERMLEPLSGEAYDRLRKELGAVSESLNEEKASALLGTALASELKERAATWQTELKESGQRDDPTRKQRIFHAQGLSSLLSDGVVRDGWFGSILQRIVKQTMGGGSEAEHESLRNFVPVDLVLPDTFDVKQAAKPVERYLSKLTSNEGKGREIAAKVLQETLDPALRTIFRFSEALGQRTIEDIVLDIRARLLQEKKELVLLIEDFAALAGIQQPLLNLMIAESYHGGQQVRAQLRTALAVTDGFLPSRQTILTRAKGEWVIPSDAPNDNDIIRRLTSMAGRYLNAARWGLAALHRQFNENQTKGAENLYSWVNQFNSELSIEDNDLLCAFGRSDNDHPLFPLNTQAIASLCRRELTIAGKLAFNPRAFINHVLRDTLLQRPEFETNQFPPDNFKKIELATQSAVTLGLQAHSETIRKRLEVVLAHWAGNPATLTSTAPPIPSGVFAAFGLPWPFQTKPTTIIPLPPDQVPLDKPPIVNPDIGPAEPINEALKQDIEQWAKGQSLPQKTANHLRKIIKDALEERIDWNSLCIRRVDLLASWIWLPGVLTGNPTTEPKLQIWKTAPVPPTVRAGLLALDRWHTHDKQWNYHQAEDDYATVQIVIDHLQPQLETWLLSSAENVLPVLLRTLHRQSLLLGLSESAEPPEVRPKELFSDAKDAITAWGILQQHDLSVARQLVQMVEGTKQGREQLQDLVRAQSGCFQGAGTSMHALHLPRLQKAWLQSESDQDFTLVREKTLAARESATAFSTVKLPVQIDRIKTLAMPASQTIYRSFGEVCTVAQFRKAIASLLARAKALDVMPNQATVAAINQAVGDIANDQLEPLIRRIGKFVEPDAAVSLNVRLARWANLDLPLLLRTAATIGRLEGHLTAIELETDATLRATGGADVAIQLDELISLLELGEELCS